MGLYLIFIVPALLLTLYAQLKVKTTFKRYSKVPSSRGITGAEAAATLLRRNGLSSVVKVQQVGGNLSDHYNPVNHTLNLSQTVYGQNSLAAIGVAAHECGHAIQHQQAYGPLALRHRLVPITNFASGLSFPIILLGFIFYSADLVLVGVIAFSLVVLFHLVTLPVEFNASRRAVAQLSEAGLLTAQESPGVEKVLRAAALTYVAAAFSAIANLLYYLLIFAGMRDD
ncbi:MAG: zinc metallopeptidase [Syntrophomonadaceae bacterium]|nr:zinc metallopeptidase [Syntrophomonadaceae bacterium]